MEKKWNIHKLALVGLMAALVFATSGIRLEIPLPVDKAAIHLGNVMCVLSGLLLGPVGGLASGIGSFFYDLVNPLYAPEALITFFNKFFIGFLAGLIAHAHGNGGRSHRRNLMGAAAGSLAYVLLYLIKSALSSQLVFDLHTQSQLMLFLLPKAATSLVNGAIACVVAVPLAAVILNALDRSGLARRFSR